MSTAATQQTVPIIANPPVAPAAVPSVAPALVPAASPPPPGFMASYGGALAAVVFVLIAGLLAYLVYGQTTKADTVTKEVKLPTDGKTEGQVVDMHTDIGEKLEKAVLEPSADLSAVIAAQNALAEQYRVLNSVVESLGKANVETHAALLGFKANDTSLDTALGVEKERVSSLYRNMFGEAGEAAAQALVDQGYNLHTGVWPAVFDSVDGLQKNQNNRADSLALLEKKTQFIDSNPLLGSTHILGSLSIHGNELAMGPRWMNANGDYDDVAPEAVGTPLPVKQGMVWKLNKATAGDFAATKASARALAFDVVTGQLKLNDNVAGTGELVLGSKLVTNYQVALNGMYDGNASLRLLDQYGTRYITGISNQALATKKI